MIRAEVLTSLARVVGVADPMQIMAATWRALFSSDLVRQ